MIAEYVSYMVYCTFVQFLEEKVLFKFITFSSDVDKFINCDVKR
jgi:hypothetical protein